MLLQRLPWGLLTVTALLSGCVQDDGPPDPAALDSGLPPATLSDLPDDLPDDLPTIRIPAGAYDASGPGPWYALEGGTLDTPADVLLVNDDTTLHRVLAMTAAVEPAAPDWAARTEHRDGDAHEPDDDGHSHGGLDGPGHGTEPVEEPEAEGDEGHDHGAPEQETSGHPQGEALFDVTLEAGESRVVRFEGEGPVKLHCHPHPWMEAEVELLPAKPRAYPVHVERVERTDATSGVVDHHEVEAEVAWNLSAPDVALVQATLEWDDSEDDVAPVEGSNAPDTLRVQLVAPDGTVVAERDGEARAGRLEIRHEPERPAWPEAVEARGVRAAADRLAQERPEDTTWSGAWTVRVILDTAPGAVPKEVGFTEDDGRQSWTLSLAAVHEYAVVA